MAFSCRILLIGSTILVTSIFLHVHFWTSLEEILTSQSWKMEHYTLGPDGDAKTTTIFETPVSFVAPPRRHCTSLPVGVLSGYAVKRQAVRDTWGKDFCVYFIVGKKDGAWPEEEATQYGDLVLLDMEEIYRGNESILPYKTALWFYVAHQQFPEAMYVLKTDDDSYVNVEGLEAELRQTQPDYWGLVHRGLRPFRDPNHKWYVPTSMWSAKVYPNFCDGSGYVLSRKALECFVSKTKTQRYLAREDVSTGVAMKACGINAMTTALVDRSGKYGASRRRLIKHHWEDHSQAASPIVQEPPAAQKKSVGPYRVLVTGGAGFIGMHTSLRLRAEGHHIVAYDNLNSYYSLTLKKARLTRLTEQGVHFVHSDVCNTTALASVLDEHHIDRVIHLSAQAGVRYSLGHPYEYTRNNVDCFVTLLEALKSRENVRLVYASSSSVYGLNDKIPFAEGDPVERPASLYAASKRMDELMAYVYHNLYGLPSIGLRFFTVYGPWGRPDMAYYTFTDKIMQGEPIDMFNHGNLERDFTYIDDVVEGIVASLNFLLSSAEVLNLGNNKPVPLKTLIEIIESSVGKKADIRSIEMQPGDMPRTFADITKSQQMLGYEPRTLLDEGIPRFVKWFKEYSSSQTTS